MPNEELTDILALEGMRWVTRNGLGETIDTLGSPIESWPLRCVHKTSLSLCFPMCLDNMLDLEKERLTGVRTNFFSIIFSMTKPESYCSSHIDQHLQLAQVRRVGSTYQP